MAPRFNQPAASLAERSRKTQTMNFRAQEGFRKAHGNDATSSRRVVFAEKRPVVTGKKPRVSKVISYTDAELAGPSRALETQISQGL